MRNQPTRIAIAILSGLLVSAGLAAPGRAETGRVSVVFTKAGFIVGVGGGQGVLSFRGRNYPFKVSGASIGATIGASTSKLVGTALNLRGPGDIAGIYSAAGAGGALAAGAGGVNCRTPTASSSSLAVQKSA